LKNFKKKAKLVRDSQINNLLQLTADKEEVQPEVQVHVENLPNPMDCLPTFAQLSDAEVARIRDLSKKSDETSSVASDASGTYSHVRMTLFPLYVSEVKSVWPENGRLRKIVSIDEAIEMCDNRPELQAALKEIKARNYHLLPEDQRSPTRVDS